MEYEQNITFEDKSLKLEEAKFFYGCDSEGESNYRDEYYVYNMDTIYSENITNYKTIFQLLYPYLLRFLLKTRFMNRNIFLFLL